MKKTAQEDEEETLFIFYDHLIAVSQGQKNRTILQDRPMAFSRLFFDWKVKRMPRINCKVLTAKETRNGF